jgi:hypothetical protein
MTIFETPVKGCFGERYYDESPDSTMLKRLHEQIEKAAEVKREYKMRELHRRSADYENLAKTVAQLSHEFSTNEHQVRVHNRRCTKCSLEVQKNKMTIKVHEHPLPTNAMEAKTVLFE